MIKEILNKIREDGEVTSGGEVSNGGQGDLGTLPNNPLQVITGQNGNCWQFKDLIKKVLKKKN